MITYYLDMDKMSNNGVICYSITKYENDEFHASLLFNRYLVQEKESIGDIALYIFALFFSKNKIKYYKGTRLMYKYDNTDYIEIPV